MTADIGDIVARALAGRRGLSRGDARELALHITWLDGQLRDLAERLVAADALVRTTLADAEPLKAEVERLRLAVVDVESGVDETTTLLVDARREVRASKAAIDAHQEWRQRAMRVIQAAKEWERSPRSDRALRVLKESVQHYGADA